MDAVTIFNDFVSLVDSENLPIEAVAIADGDSVVAEHHFTPDQERNIYSHTKSYVSTAVGVAVDDGILGLDDKLTDAFAEYVPNDAQPELFDITLRHLLTMSSGFNHAYLMNSDRRGGVGAPDYLEYMFSRRIEVEPGTYSHHKNVSMYKNATDESDGMVNTPVDMAIMPFCSNHPLLIECKCAGDATNTNKRRKEEDTKVSQLRGTYGDVTLYLFLCGYFGCLISRL